MHRVGAAGKAANGLLLAVGAGGPWNVRPAYLPADLPSDPMCCLSPQYDRALSQPLPPSLSRGTGVQARRPPPPALGPSHGSAPDLAGLVPSFMRGLSVVMHGGVGGLRGVGKTPVSGRP